MLGGRNGEHRVTFDGDLVKRASIAVAHAEVFVFSGTRVAKAEEIAHGDVFVEIERVVVHHELKRAPHVDVRRRKLRWICRR